MAIAASGTSSSGSGLRVAVDARYLAGARGGVQCTVANLLVELCRQEPGLSLLLVVRRNRCLPELPGARVQEQVFDVDPVSLTSTYGFAHRVRLDDWPLLHAPHNFLPPGLRSSGVVTVHDVMWLQDPRNIALHPARRLAAAWFYRRFLPEGVRRAAHVIAVSRATADALDQFVPEARRKTTVVPNGLDPFFHPIADAAARELTRELGLDGRKLVLCVGNGSPHKNHRRAIQAFMRAFGDRDDHRMVLVRRFQRWDPEVEHLLAEPAVRRRVVALPYVTGEQVRALYCQAESFFFPSWVEGFGLPILEAMACRCPVVTSNRSALVEVAGDAALTVDPFDVEAMATALRRLADEESLRQELVARGLERIRAFAWQAAAAQTLEIYRHVARAA